MPLFSTSLVGVVVALKYTEIFRSNPDSKPLLSDRGHLYSSLQRTITKCTWQTGEFQNLCGNTGEPQFHSEFLCCTFLVRPSSPSRQGSSGGFSNQIILPSWKPKKKKKPATPPWQTSLLWISTAGWGPSGLSAQCSAPPRSSWPVGPRRRGGNSVVKLQTMTQLLDGLQTTMRQLRERKLASSGWVERTAKCHTVID